MRQDLLFYNLNSIFMKKLYLFAALAAMLAACSENDLTSEKLVTAPQAGEEAAVQFDAYLSRGTTRAGKSGVLTLTGTTLPDISLQATGTNGFGVFGYYTNGEDYSGITKPNFFYNQQITYSSGWTYSPLRYWPNEFGGDALSDQVDKVTLFAYAPYVDVTPSSGVVKSEPTTNIIGMTRNNVTGDPFIKYVSTMDPTKCVDLCYGVAADQFTSSSSSVNFNNIATGKPYLNVVKPGTDANSKIKFDFKHALAQFVVDIDAKVKDLTSTTDNEVQTDYTRIWVRSVTFTGITQSGSLNLNSNAGSPEWYDINGTNKITTGSLTVYDGRKDEKEAMDEAPNETPATLNSKLVQDEKYTLDNKIQEPNETDHPGVTESAVNLFNGTDNYPVFAIPTGETMRVTIVYDVETVDPNLAFYLSDGVTRGTTVQNTIYKDITAFGAIKAGKKYTLHLHLGMRTVDFDASVDPWDDTNSTGNVDLPSNMPTFDVGSTNSVTVGATVGTYKFAITGFGGSEVITAFTNTGGKANGVTPASPWAADGSGVFEGNAVYTDNNTVTNKTSEISVTGTEHSAPTTINVTQLAHDLGLSVTTGPTAGVANPTITLGTTATGIEEEDWTTAAKFKVYKNGTELAISTNYSLNATTPTAPVLTFTAAATAGDVYTITIQTGNATEETVTVTAVTAAP